MDAFDNPELILITTPTGAESMHAILIPHFLPTYFAAQSRATPKDKI